MHNFYFLSYFHLKVLFRHVIQIDCCRRRLKAVQRNREHQEIWWEGGIPLSRPTISGVIPFPLWHSLGQLQSCWPSIFTLFFVLIKLNRRMVTPFPAPNASRKATSSSTQLSNPCLFRAGMGPYRGPYSWMHSQSRRSVSSPYLFRTSMQPCNWSPTFVPSSQQWIWMTCTTSMLLDHEFGY